MEGHRRIANDATGRVIGHKQAGTEQNASFTFLVSLNEACGQCASPLKHTELYYIERNLPSTDLSEGCIGKHFLDLLLTFRKEYGENQNPGCVPHSTFNAKEAR